MKKKAKGIHFMRKREKIVEDWVGFSFAPTSFSFQ